jgi:hypothetical protein
MADGAAPDHPAPSPDFPPAQGQAEAGATAEAGTIRDGGAGEVWPSYGCAAACQANEVCLLTRFGGGVEPRGGCAAVPANCRAEAGVPDGGTTCNQCVGFTLCQGAFGCLGTTTPTYHCGI